MSKLWQNVRRVPFSGFVVMSMMLGMVNVGWASASASVPPTGRLSHLVPQLALCGHSCHSSTGGTGDLSTFGLPRELPLPAVEASIIWGSLAGLDNSNARPGRPVDHRLQASRQTRTRSR